MSLKANEPSAPDVVVAMPLIEAVAPAMGTAGTFGVTFVKSVPVTVPSTTEPATCALIDFTILVSTVLVRPQVSSVV